MSMRERDGKGRFINDAKPHECYACGRTVSTDWTINHGTSLSLCHNCYMCILRNPNRGVKMYSDEERVCYACGGHNEKKKSVGEYVNWFYNKPTRLLICNICYNIIFRKGYRSPKTRKFLINRARKYTFMDKKVIVRNEVRVGVCNWCRAVAGIDCRCTALHHDEGRYDKNNPSRYTIEICDSCHGKETFRLGETATWKYQVYRSAPLLTHCV